MKHCTWHCSDMHVVHHPETGADIGFCSNEGVRAAEPMVDLFEITGIDYYRNTQPKVLTTWGRPCLLAENGRQLRLGEGEA